MSFEKYESAKIRTHIDGIRTESYRMRSDACDFLAQEIDYAKQMCDSRQLAAIGDKSFYNHLNTRLILLKNSTNIMKRQIETVFLEWRKNSINENDWCGSAFYEAVSSIDLSLGTLSEVLQGMANSLVQRRFRNASSMSRLQVQRSISRMRLSEVHLDYADTFRAINSIANDYFRCIRKAYLNTYKHISPPVIIVSGGEEFSLEEFYYESNIPLFSIIGNLEEGLINGNAAVIIEKQNIETLVSAKSLKRYFAHMISYSRLISPRYFPVMIRYGPLLSHELFHPIIRMAELIRDCQRGVKKPTKEAKDDVRELIQSNYGKAMSFLVYDRQMIKKSIFTHLKRIYTNKRDSKYNDLFLISRTVSFRNRRIEPELKSILDSKSILYTREILSDIGGLLVSQQAYLAALVCNCYLECLSNLKSYGRNHLNDVYFTERQHPPMVARVHILLDLARCLGFKKMATRITGFIDEVETNPEIQSINDTLCNIWIKNWWIRSRVRKKVIIKIVSPMRRHLDISELYKICQIENSDRDYPPMYDEIALESVFDKISEWIDDSTLIWDNFPQIKSEIKSVINESRENRGHRPIELKEDFVLRPTDIANAMWYKMLKNKENFKITGRQRLQWRLALSKNSGTRDIGE